MINRIYQTVQAIANKDQRGYISPQEFNLFADHAQMDIFEQYFFDVGQFKRLGRTDKNHQDAVSNLEHKIDMFMKNTSVAPSFIYPKYGGEDYTVGVLPLPSDIYRLVDVRTQDGYGVERLSVEKFETAMRSYLTRPTVSRPSYCFKGVSANIFPAATVKMSYITKPVSPKWTFQDVGGTPFYNPDANDHQDFQLHASEQEKLTLRILKLAGVATKDMALAQAASQEEAKDMQLEKS